MLDVSRRSPDTSLVYELELRAFFKSCDPERIKALLIEQHKDEIIAQGEKWCGQFLKVTLESEVAESNDKLLSAFRDLAVLWKVLSSTLSGNEKCLEIVWEVKDVIWDRNIYHE